jgi:hypothetical protein
VRSKPGDLPEALHFDTVEPVGFSRLIKRNVRIVRVLRS